MNKDALKVALGAMLAVSAMVTKDSFSPPPPPCEASAEAKAIIQAQQETINQLTESLKKSVDSLAKKCEL
jgi:hypothetical protein